MQQYIFIISTTVFGGVQSVVVYSVQLYIQYIEVCTVQLPVVTTDHSVLSTVMVSIGASCLPWQMEGGFLSAVGLRGLH